MTIDIRDTHTLLMGVEQLYPPKTFMRDRYFPTNAASDIFSTTDVLVEYREGTKKLAPFVAPRKGGVSIMRKGHNMKSFEPSFIAPKRTLTIDDLKVRGFGEAILTKLTPEQRQMAMILKDASELGELITRREEAMAAETMLTNGCIMREMADDMNVRDEKEVRFYDEASNPATYTPTTKWGASGAKIIDDINSMVKMLSSRGLPATELLIAPDIAPLIVNDEYIQKLMDINGYNMGGVDPATLPAGVARIARLNVYGRMIDILCYDETYEDENGTIKQFIPAGNVVLSAPACGRTLYGAVTQLEQMDGEFHTYTGMRIPKYISDATANTREITISSAPLLIPNNKNPWVAAKVTV